MLQKKLKNSERLGIKESKNENILKVKSNK